MPGNTTHTLYTHTHTHIIHIHYIVTSTYIWVLADTEYRNEYSIIPLQFKEPVSHFQQEFEHFEV